jgi:hypothetical protein
MLQKRLLILRHQMIAARERIEIAVAALRGAIGDMNIDT